MNHYGLTCVERLIIESIQRGNNNLHSLMRDTNLTLFTLNTAIKYLVVRNLIIQKSKSLSINPNLNDYLREEFNSPSTKKHELLELLNGMLSTQNKFKMKKFYLTPKDEPYFKAIIKNLEDFLDKLPPADQSISTFDHKVFFWGGDGYGTVIQNLLRGATK
jgi:hypothetical protein